MLLANFIGQMIGNRELQEVPGNAFMSEDRSWIFDRRANIKIPRLRVVSRDEIETGRVFVVNARGIHEPTRPRRLERFPQLPDLKRTEIIWQANETIFLQEINHLGLAAFIRLQERGLIGRNICSALRIGISEFWIRQQRLEGAITG